MRCAIVSLPWASATRPSAPLSALLTYVRKHEPSFCIRPIHAYLEMASLLGIEEYSLIADHGASFVGEMVYASLLYPDLASTAELTLAKVLGEAGTPSWRRIRDAADMHLRRFAQNEDWAAFDVVGFSTCFYQLFANLVFARQVKTVAPQTKCVFGGSAMVAGVGESLLDQYEWIDCVIKGEGEIPFLELLRAIDNQREWSSIPNILSNPDKGSAGRVLSATDSVKTISCPELPCDRLNHLDDLPFPDYSDFQKDFQKRFQVPWILTMEGSRGCWWDREHKTGNPKHRCTFCNYTIHWNGYREKSPKRVAEEMGYLASTYGDSRIFFLDNIVRYDGVGELADQIEALGMDLTFFQEGRTSISPFEFVRLWEAGLQGVLLGIEALSTSVLKKLRKGTSAIMNLQAMKLCEELDVYNDSNLITHFPGVSQAEIDETAFVMTNYAVGFQPLRPVRFLLYRGSYVQRFPDEYGVTNLRNHDFYQAILPGDVFRDLKLLDLSFDSNAAPLNWEPITEAHRMWRDRYVAARPPLASPYGNVSEKRSPLLRYFDGKMSVRIVDDRVLGRSRTFLLHGAARDIYMHCHQVRSLAEIFREFPDMEEESIIRAINRFVEKRLMFREGQKVLSLACAIRPEYAAKRIKRDQERARQTPQ